MEMVDRKNPAQNLSETLHSLLGLKAHLTSSWVNAVCDIIQSFPSPGSPNSFEPKQLEAKKSDDTGEDESGRAVSNIKDELVRLNLQINRLNIQRRQVLNDYLDLKGNIRVFCRVRPNTVIKGNVSPVLALDSNNIFVGFAGSKRKHYSFDKVFQPNSTQEEVFKEVEPVIKSALDGYNACIFAYGQTGAGKTFTMDGVPDSPGLVPRTIQALFEQATDSNYAYCFTFSMFEIYMGHLKDLLAQPTNSANGIPPCLSIQTDPKGGIEIENLVVIQVSSSNQALKLYRLGCRFRSTASTNSNKTSSRSHCMIRMTISCPAAPERRHETSKVWLVDLGGSERVLKTKASGRRLEEGKAINLSLSALGDVINALQTKRPHIPFRNSKLTQVLKDSLGEDSKTLMLVHISPKEEDLCETICTLGFAVRVRSIHLGTEDQTERAKKEKAMEKLHEIMANVESEHQKVKSAIEKLNRDLETLTGALTSYADEKIVTEVPPALNLEIGKDKTNDFTASAPSNLPRFMKATICSQRKSGPVLHSSSEKHPTNRRRRRPSSHHAGSVTFPLRSNSEQNSDCNVSQASCLPELNMNDSADMKTESSQDAYDCDVKMVVFSEERSSSRTNVDKGNLKRTVRLENSMPNSYNSMGLLEVNHGVNLQKSAASYGHRIKRVPSIPLPQKQHGETRTDAPKSCQDEFNTSDLKTYECSYYDMQEKLVAEGGLESSIYESENDKAMNLSYDFKSEGSGLNRDDEITRIRDSDDSPLMVEDNGSDGHCSRSVWCDGPKHSRDEFSFPGSTLMHNIKGELQSCFTPSEFTFAKTAAVKEPSVSETGFSLQNPSHEFPLDVSFQDTQEDAFPRLYLPGQKHRRALFMDHMDQRDGSTRLKPMKADGWQQNKGKLHHFVEKIQMTYAIALLGLGIESIGLGHDFFYGLSL